MKARLYIPGGTAQDPLIVEIYLWQNKSLKIKKEKNNNFLSYYS